MATDSSIASASRRLAFFRLTQVVALFLLLVLVPSACTVTTTSGTDGGVGTGGAVGAGGGVGTGGSSVGTGSAVVTWTIASGTDATQCTTYGATGIAIHLTDSAGNTYGSTTTAACSAFSATIPNLPAGVYGVTAQMVDANNGAVSTMTSSESVTVVASGSGTVAFDFPVASFTAPSSTTGAMTVTWTVATTTDAAQCATYGATSIVIHLTDSTGAAYGTATTVACSAFTTTIATFPPGTYGVTAQMVDAGNAPVSTMAPSESVIVTAGTTATQAFDFPATSFTGPTATTGSMTLTWTVATTTDAAQCTTYGATSIVFNLTDSTGAPYGTATTVACSAFTTTIAALPAGSYGVTAQMVDASNTPVSTMVPSQSVVVTAGSSASQAFDFPAASFTPPNGTNGSIVVTWTVASTSDSAQCTAHSAASIVIQLTAGGAPYGTATTAACSAFTTTVANLPPGTYGVSAHMVDTSSAPVSTTIPPQNVVVTAGATAAQAFDFPAASFTN